MVQEALELLLENKYYRANQVHLNKEVLQQNGNISDLTSLQLEEITKEDPLQPSQEDLYGAHLPSSFVPNAIGTPRATMYTVRSVRYTPTPLTGDHMKETFVCHVCDLEKCYKLFLTTNVHCVHGRTVHCVTPDLCLLEHFITEHTKSKGTSNTMLAWNPLVGLIDHHGPFFLQSGTHNEKKRKSGGA